MENKIKEFAVYMEGYNDAQKKYRAKVVKKKIRWIYTNIF